jgi:hypothetical protein
MPLVVINVDLMNVDLMIVWLPGCKFEPPSRVAPQADRHITKSYFFTRRYSMARLLASSISVELLEPARWLEDRVEKVAYDTILGEG